MVVMLRKLLWVAALGAVVGLTASVTAQGAGLGTVRGAGVAGVASLSSSGPQVEFLAVSATPGAVLAAGFGEADVFAEPAGGWVNSPPSATLVDSTASTYPVGLSISGGTAVVGERASGDSLFEDVFVQPTGGWSGMVAPAARLAASDGARLTGAVIAGNTIVVADFAGRALYVFTEPAAGWSGVVSETARLTDSRGAEFMGGLAFDGSAVFATAGRRIDVFTEPAAGWSGELHEHGTLVGNDQILGPVEADGSTVLAGHSLFSEPAGGWTGAIRPSRHLYAPLSVNVADEALSDGVAAFSGAALGAEHQCPCGAQIAVATLAAGRATETLTAPVALNVDSDTGVLPIVISGHQLISTGGNTVQVSDLNGTFGHVVRPPTIARQFLAGLASGRPRLAVTFITPNGDPPPDSFRLTVPHGLALVKSEIRAAQHVVITGARVDTLRVERSTLVVSLRDVRRRRLRLSIQPKALTESPSLRARARRLATSTSHQPTGIRLTGTLRTHDFLGDTATSVLHLDDRS